MKDVTRTTEAPDNRLGQLSAKLIELFESEQADGVRLIVMLTDDEAKQSMAALSGYDSDGHAAADLLSHVAAVFEANGRKLMIMPIGKG